MKTRSSTETQKLAQELVNKLGNPTVIALQGDLGSGKTTFTQGLAKELGIEKRILSPTFVFLRSYKLVDKRFKFLHHFDLYRCETETDVRSTGLEEILKSGDSLVLIEWPELAKHLLPNNTVWVKFDKISENERAVEIQQP